MAVLVFLWICGEMVLAGGEINSSSLPPAKWPINIATCLENIHTRYFSDSALITIITNPDDLLILPDIEVPRVIFTSETSDSLECLESNLINDLVVFIAGYNVTSLERLFNLLPRYSMMPIILFLVEERSVNFTSVVIEAVDLLWKYHYVNALVAQVNDVEIGVYGYVPYHQKCDTPGSPILVGIWKHDTGWGNHSTLYPRNTIVRLNGCLLRCATEDVPWAVIIDGSSAENATGVYITMLEVIGKAMNFTFVTQKPLDGNSWGWIYENGSIFGIIGDVLKGNADLGVAQWLQNWKRNAILDLTRPTDQACLTWSVPSKSGSMDSGWNLIFQEFSTLLWLALLLITLAGSILVMYISKLEFSSWRSEVRNNGFKRISFLICYSAATLLGVPRPAPPKQAAIRLFYASWFSFALVMSTAYIASLHNLLESPWTRGEIASIQELAMSDLTPTFHPNLNQFIKELGDESAAYAALYKKKQTEPDLNEGMNAVAYNRSAALMSLMNGLQYYASRVWSTEEGDLVHIMPECVLVFYPAPFILKKGSVLTPTINGILERLVEGGIVDFWISKYNVRRRRRRNTAHILGLDHLFGAFLLLIFGLSVALCVFIVEVKQSSRHQTRVKASLKKR